MFKMFYTYFYMLGARLFNAQSVLFLSRSEFQANELNAFKKYLTVKAEETISGVCEFLRVSIVSAPCLPAIFTAPSLMS